MKKEWTEAEAIVDYRSKMVKKAEQNRNCRYCKFSNHDNSMCLVKLNNIGLFKSIKSYFCEYYTFDKSKVK